MINCVEDFFFMKTTNLKLQVPKKYRKPSIVYIPYSSTW